MKKKEQQTIITKDRTWVATADLIREIRLDLPNAEVFEDHGTIEVRLTPTTERKWSMDAVSSSMFKHMLSLAEIKVVTIFQGMEQLFRLSLHFIPYDGTTLEAFVLRRMAEAEDAVRVSDELDIMRATQRRYGSTLAESNKGGTTEVHISGRLVAFRAAHYVAVDTDHPAFDFAKKDGATTEHGFCRMYDQAPDDNSLMTVVATAAFNWLDRSPSDHVTLVNGIHIRTLTHADLLGQRVAMN
jgi:hypothetical protein